MYGIKYNDTSLEVNKQEEAIRNANKAWNSKEVQDSLEKSCQKCKKLEREENQKNEQKLAGVKMWVIQHLHKQLEAQYGKQLMLLHYKASYSWPD